MKLRIATANLRAGLEKAGRVASTHSTLPVLGNVLLATEKGRLKLAATNLESLIVAWVDADVEAEGAITVPARVLAEVVKSLTADDVGLELDARTFTLKLKAGRSKASIKGLAAEEFPLIPSRPTEAASLPAGLLKRLVALTAFAAGKDDTRPVLRGIQFGLAAGKLEGAATDGFRLSRVEMPGSFGVKDALQAIVPARPLAEAMKLFADGPIDLALENNRLVLADGDVFFTISLTAGNFPDFRPVIPQKHTTRVVVERAKALYACRTAAIFARQANYTVRLDVTPGEIEVSAISAETGDGAARLEAVVEGPAVNMAFNVAYLEEVLAAMGAPQVALELTTPTEPAVLRPVGNGAGEFMHLLMPMHFGREAQTG